MINIGIYYAYWTSDWDVDFNPFIDRTAGLGFDVLEVNAATIARMTSEERQRLKSHADDRGIALSYCLGLPREYDIASEGEAVRQKGIAFLRQIAQAIGEMGGGTLGGILYGCWPGSMPEGQTDRGGFVRRSIDSMKEAIVAAEDNNVTFCMEVVNRFEQFILNTCEEALAYVDAVGSPSAKVMLDTFHMNIEEDLLGQAIQQAGDKLGHFHIGENNRRPPGYGHIPWTEVGSALREIGYQGYAVLEPFLRPGGEVGRDIKVYRDLSRGMDLDQEARRALQFVRGILK